MVAASVGVMSLMGYHICPTWIAKQLFELHGKGPTNAFAEVWANYLKKPRQSSLARIGK